MLRITYGTDWQKTADSLLDCICGDAEQGVTGQILIVPEQFSFDAERRLCERGGDPIARSAEVLSFTRLYDRVCALTGGAAVQIMDRSGRLIAMAGALDQVRAQLKIYARQVVKPEFLLQLLALYEEFCSYGVDEDGLARAIRGLEGRLAEKLEELRLIFHSYEAVTARAAIDPATQLTRLADKLTESGFAKGRRICLDGFSDFTAQELDVIAALLEDADELTVSLLCDDLRAGQEGFAVTRRTAKTLQALAQRVGCELVTERIAPREDGSCAAHLRAQLFAAQTPEYPDPAPLTLWQCPTPYDEAAAAVAAIQRLVRQGVRWRQIAVACTDAAQFLPALERLFAKYRIPGYFSGTKAILQTPTARMLLSALRAASGRMQAADVMDYLKSGYAPIDQADCDLLDNYAQVWNLQGSRWEQEFRNDPAGYGSNAKPEDYRETLARLNAARKTAVQPLIALKNGLAAAKNTGEQILALDRFLEQIGLADRLSAAALAFEEAGDFRRAQQTAQLYDSVLDTMEQIYGVLGQSVRSPEDFYQFFRAALSQRSVGTIPQALDSVSVGTLRDLRNNRAPYLFVLGATDRLLPPLTQQKGLLTRTERKTLQKNGLSFAPDSLEQLERELLAAYTVLSSASEGWFVSCRQGEPSYFWLRLGALLPRHQTAVPRLLPATETQAAARYAGAAQSPKHDALEAIAARLKQQADYEPGRVGPETVRALYGARARLSASRADKLASCRFAFFLRYGLKAEQRREAKLDAPLYGSFVHAVLEQTARQVMAEGGFHTVSRERLDEITTACIERFLETELPDFSAQPERTQYLFRRRWEEVRAVSRELWEELRQSDFEPVAFELPFANRTAVPIEGDVAAAELVGFVDRVDRYTAPDGRDYVRVVDYKTGKKDFDYTDILSGIGLQMLIYLYVLEQRGLALLGTQAEGAGVLYVPAKVDVLSNVSRLSEAEAEKLRREASRRKGLVLADEAVQHAMEPNDPPRFLPCTKDRSGRQRASASRAQFDALRQFVFRKLGELTDALYSGEVAPNPYRRGEQSPCNYCEYRAVCHAAGGNLPVRELAETGEERFWQTVERSVTQDG